MSSSQRSRDADIARIVELLLRKVADAGDDTQPEGGEVER